MTTWTWQLRAPNAWHAEEDNWALEVWADEDGSSWLWEVFDLSDEVSDAPRASGKGESASNAKRKAEACAVRPGQ